MSIKTTLTLAAVATGMGLFGTALAASHGDDHGQEDSAERALVILTSDSLQTQAMAMILSNAMQQQGADLSILLCDAAGDLAVEGYASAEPVNTPPENPAGQVTPEGILQMLITNGAQVDVCAIYLPNSEHEQADLREGVGVAAPGPMAEMMRDSTIPVFSF
ncbi:hypothetical protein [Halomonas chromatireducens]|uniref:DsrE/DsrF-like family protein n=1 Tax=Halomonas chromatireducens TaxID=507626 RepID=A0A120JVP4_9GAMM|nr:hypothetical protein [Halomonas chromatireducens]AMC99811.1 hypothetical protein LOKO_00730 [Halomonas chromatireducens]